MHGKYTIAICDVLGFSALVSSVDLHTIVEGLLLNFRKALHFAVNKSDFPTEVPRLSEIDANAKIGIAWFSDTILLYTREDTDDCLRELLATVGWLLFVTMDGPTRIRAGIAYGDAFIEPANSLYVGKAIIEAYNWEKCQQWAGASLADSAMKRIPAYAYEFADWWLVPYDIPLKNGTSTRLAVNWAAGFHHPGAYLKWSETSDVPAPEEWDKCRPICEKWQNTKDFHDRVCRSCNKGGSSASPATGRS